MAARCQSPQQRPWIGLVPKGPIARHDSALFQGQIGGVPGNAVGKGWPHQRVSVRFGGFAEGAFLGHGGFVRRSTLVS